MWYNTGVTRWNPWAELERMHQAMDRLYGGNPWSGNAGDGVLPPVNVRLEDDAAVMTAEIPGVSPGSLEITVEDRVVTIKGQRSAGRRPAAPGGCGANARGAVRRSFTMPFGWSRATLPRPRDGVDPAPAQGQRGTPVARRQRRLSGDRRGAYRSGEPETENRDTEENDHERDVPHRSAWRTGLGGTPIEPARVATGRHRAERIVVYAGCPGRPEPGRGKHGEPG